MSYRNRTPATPKPKVRVLLAEYVRLGREIALPEHEEVRWLSRIEERRWWAECARYPDGKFDASSMPAPPGSSCWFAKFGSAARTFHFEPTAEQLTSNILSWPPVQESRAITMAQSRLPRRGRRGSGRASDAWPQSESPVPRSGQELPCKAWRNPSIGPM